MEAEPGNRLVVDVLEAEWNEKLRALHDAQEELERRRAEDHQRIDGERRKKILALASDFPRLWNDPRTPQRERKRMVRLLIEDVTLTKGAEINVGIRFRGGATQSLTVPRAQPAWQQRQTAPEVIAEIDALLDHHTAGQVAALLNERGCVSGWGKPFTTAIVKRLQREHGLKTRYDRLRAFGMLTDVELAAQLGIKTRTVPRWARNGLLRALAYNDKNECLYEHPGDDPPVKQQGRPLSEQRRFAENVSNLTKEA